MTLAVLALVAPLAGAQPPPPGYAIPAPMFSVTVTAGEALENALRTGSVSERARAVFVAGQCAGGGAGRLLAPLLNDPRREVREWAGIFLAWNADERGLSGARAALVGNRWWIRYYAVVALWRLGGQRALDAVARCAVAYGGKQHLRLAVF